MRSRPRKTSPCPGACGVTVQKPTKQSDLDESRCKCWLSPCQGNKAYGGMQFTAT